jgi:hypothetical protein
MNAFWIAAVVQNRGVVATSILELASQCPPIQAVKEMPPARTVRAGDRSSLQAIGRDGVLE